MNKLRLISLDLTGTVFQFRTPVHIQYHQIAVEKMGYQGSPDEIKQSFIKSKKALSTSHPHFGSTTGISSKEWWTRLVQDTFQDAIKTNYQSDKVQEIALELYDLYSTSQAYKVYDDARLFVNNLRNKDVTLAALTNFDNRVIDLVRQMDLHFDFVVTSETVRCSKPDTKFFHRALLQRNKEKGVQGHQILHIGDDVIKDYTGAKNASWNAFLLDRRQRQEPPATNEIFADFNEIWDYFMKRDLI